MPWKINSLSCNFPALNYNIKYEPLINKKITMDLKGKVIGYDKKILVLTGSLLIVAGVFFYAGAKYEKHKLSALGLLIEKNKKDEISMKGFLIAKDEKSFTIKMADSSEKIVPLAGSSFGNNGNGVSEDFFVGHLLIITGKNNSDGTFVTENIRKSKKSPKVIAPETESVDEK